MSTPDNGKPIDDALEKAKGAEFVDATKGCPRCGEDHEPIAFQPLAGHDRYSHWAQCPTTGQPILGRLEDRNEE